MSKPIEHQWRVQSFSKSKPSATVMAYIDQRDLMEVLDKYCIYGWQKKYEEVAGNLFCSIGIIMPDGSIHWRSDCGVESNQDAEKGRASDAAKRAGVNWGIGRFLYDMKIQYVKTNAKKESGNYPYCIDEQGNQIRDLTKHINNINKVAEKPVILPVLMFGTEKWAKVLDALKQGYTMEQIKSKNQISKETETRLLNELEQA